jgi:hypothetical protein
MSSNRLFEVSTGIDESSTENMNSGSSSKILFGEMFLLTILSVVVLAIAVTRASGLLFDEFYHFLAARSWAADGTLAIGDGVYNRAWLITKAVGVAFVLFGESETVARIVPAAGGVAWLLVVFLWTRLFMGRIIAWIAVLLLLFSAEFLNLSVFIRFYTWHSFFVFLGFSLVTVLLYTSVTGVYRLVFGILAILSFAVAFHLQYSTLIAIAGIVTWLAVTHFCMILSYFKRLVRNPAIFSLAVILTVAAVGVIYASGLAQQLWTIYTHTALWNVNAIQTYHWFFHAGYPSLWAVFPIATIVAATYRPPFGLACVIIFSVAFFLHTFGGMREIRYLSHALPFFFIIGAIMITLISQRVYREIRNLDMLYLNGGLAKRGLLMVVWVIIFVLTAPLFITNTAGMKSAIAIVGNPTNNFHQGTDWSDFNLDLKQIANGVDVVVVTYCVAGFYYLGDIDFVLSRTIMLETDTRDEFGYDGRLGRQVISEAESFKLIMDCHASGIIVVDQLRWDNLSTGDDAEIIQLIKTHMKPVTNLNTDSVRVFMWEQEDFQDDNKPPACSVIQPIL